jgi:hypothetical protein
VARTPESGIDRRAFLHLVALGAGAVALAGPGRAAAATAGADLGGIDGTPAGVAVGSRRTVVVGADAGGDAAAWWSAGSGWVRAAPPPGADALLGDVAATAGGFVAVGSVAGRPAAWWSADGSSWELRSALTMPGHLVAVGGSAQSVLAGGARQDGETAEGTGPLLVSLDRAGTWGSVSTHGIGDLPHGSVTAVARHGQEWVLAGTSTGAGGLWRSTTDGRWSPSPVPGREPVLWSSLVPLGTSLAALGTTIAGGVARLARSDDARSWRVDAVPPALAALGVDLRAATSDRAGSVVVAGASGAVDGIVSGVLR